MIHRPRSKSIWTGFAVASAGLIVGCSVLVDTSGLYDLSGDPGRDVQGDMGREGDAPNDFFDAAPAEDAPFRQEDANADATTPDAGPDATTPDAGPDAAPIRYVKGVANNGNGGTATVQFPVNRSGNFILLSVYWGAYAGNNASVSATDSSGNTYVTAVGPTRWLSGQAAEQLLYAKNIKDSPSSNTVTVQLSPAPPAGATMEVRGYEYSGLGPTPSLDAISANASTTGRIDTGVVETTSPNELVFGVAQYTQGNCGSSSVLSLDPDGGTTYTARPVPAIGGGVLAADAVLDQGTYHIPYSINCTPAQWVSQLATFRR